MLNFTTKIINNVITIILVVGILITCILYISSLKADLRIKQMEFDTLQEAFRRQQSKIENMKKDTDYFENQVLPNKKKEIINKYKTKHENKSNDNTCEVKLQAIKAKIDKWFEQ